MSKKTDTNKPRAFTTEEVRAMFLQHIWGLISYWNGEGNSNVDKDLPSREKLEGLAHSILVMIDGGSMRLPGFDLVCKPHSDDKEYCKSQGENWMPMDAVINDCQLHEHFYAEQPD